MAWLGSELRIGTEVREKNGRHCGKLRARENDIWIVVWNATGWVSYLHKDDIERWREEP